MKFLRDKYVGNSRQIYLPVIPVDLELLGSVHSFQGAKALQKAHDDDFRIQNIVEKGKSTCKGTLLDPVTN